MGDEEGGLHPSKKRVAGRQISKDHPDSDEDAPEPEMGTFKKASEEVMATRRIVKVRRNQAAAAPAASSNPFAGICLIPSNEPTPKATPTQAQTTGDVSATEQNNTPETSIPEIKEPEVKSNVDDVEKKEVNGGAKLTESSPSGIAELKNDTTDVKAQPAETAEDEHAKASNDTKAEADESDKKDAEVESGKSENVVTDVGDKEKPKEDQEDKATTAGPFSSFKQLSSTQNAFTGFSGTGFSSSSFGFGSFATGASTLGASSGSLFGFNSENPSQSTNGSPSALLSSGTDSAKSGKPLLQEVPLETGEENEKAVFTADAILYEYLDGGWKERGKGELKLNVSVSNSEKARLVMRARGNYRLILNASLYPDLSLTNMEKRGVTFACVNSAGEANDMLTTFALKFKDSSFVEEFQGLVSIHKGKKSSAEATANPPEAADDQV